MPVFSLLKPGLKAFVDNRNWLVIALFIFVAGAFYSYFAVAFEAAPLPGVESQLAEVEELFRMILDNPPLITALLVFVNNFFSMLIMLMFGALAGISPLVSLFLNGFILGAVAVAYKAEGIPILTMLIAGILPHGLFELPALFLCGAFALKLGYHCVAAPLPEKTRLESFRLIWKEITPALPLVTLLLLGAALIEIFITGRLVESFL
jgi:stage II sporulation protein M